MDNFIEKVREDGTIEYVNADYDEIIKKAEAERLDIDLSDVYHPSEEELAADAVNNVHIQRIREYPPITDFADAWVKQDEDALEEYRQACLAVKAKYPKPE
jgi:hypothetical protein